MARTRPKHPSVARSGDRNNVGDEGAEAAFDGVPVAVEEKIVPETPVNGKAARTATKLTVSD